MAGRQRVSPGSGGSGTGTSTTTTPPITGDPSMGIQEAGGGGNQAALEAMTWEESGNLIGNPPVRTRLFPPNIGIVEDEAVYGQRRAAAQATMAAQQIRADSMLDSDGNVLDHRYWFAQVYKFVTEGELQEAAAGTFYYPGYVMQSVRYFDQIYEDNLEAANAGGTVEEHWAEAFQVAVDSGGITTEEVLGVIAGGGGGAALAGPLGAICGMVAGDAIAEMYLAITNLVVSMKAHIRYDLPRAEAWVFNSSYAGMENAQIQDFQADFQSMGGIFDRAGERMNPIIAAKTGVPVTLMPRMMQDLAMDYWFDANMATERADTWSRAEELVGNGSAGTGPYTEGPGGALHGNVTAADNMSELNTLPADLRPSMEDSAEGYDDDQVRDIAGSEGVAGLARRPCSDRIRMLRGLMSGATFDDDEATILDVLRASLTAGDVVTVIDGASPWEMAYAVDGDEFKQLRAFFRAHYYPATSQSAALTLICRCLDGETAEWEEEMVADIILDRSDGRTLITQIGERYDGGGFSEGLNKLEWQLDGADQDRIEAVHGTSGSFW
jgi:hypothetical protein